LRPSQQPWPFRLRRSPSLRFQRDLPTAVSWQSFGRGLATLDYRSELPALYQTIATKRQLESFGRGLATLDYRSVAERQPCKSDYEHQRIQRSCEYTETRRDRADHLSWNG